MPSPIHQRARSLPCLAQVPQLPAERGGACARLLEIDARGALHPPNSRCLTLAAAQRISGDRNLDESR
jgi:hypothetical protein